MKKIKVSIFAVIAIVMGIAASAFTAPRSGSASGAETTYWFAMDAAGTHVTTTQLSNPGALCPNQGSDCAREYNESQTIVVAGVRQVKAGQENLQIDSKGKEE
jgi:hypothetical protein